MNMISYFIPDNVQDVLFAVFQILFATIWIWLPFFLVVAAFKMYMRYIQLHFIQKQGGTLLEIKLPAEIQKSPRAMEVVISQLYQTGTSKNFIEAFWDGKVRPWWSLELVGIGGDVHFFIWTQDKWKNIVESQIYAQYPNVEIYEVPDYTYSLVHDPKKWGMWGTYFKLTQDDVYPIKTYVDYKLDVQEGLEEEFKVDPITPVIEYLGQLKKGEQCWYQILIQAHRKEKITDLRLFPQSDWKKRIEAEIKKNRQALKEKVPSITGEGMIEIGRVPTTGERETVEALERSMGKWPFEVMIRAIYLADNNAFTAPNIPALINSIRQYSSNSGNGFKLGWFTDYDHPWNDFRRIRRNKIEKQMLDAYKRRSIFNHPYKNFHIKPYILTTEELATIYHFPGGVATTPTFARIPSRKAEAPTNLPG